MDPNRNAALFPGQGIKVADILNGLDDGHALLQRATAVLGFPLRRRVSISARTPGGKLPTSVAQPAIFVASCIAWDKASERGEKFDYLAGHSLGEYAALVAGEALSFEDALRVVRIRGDAMHAASKMTPGGMAALIGLDLDVVESLARESGVQVANDNAPGQVVVAGAEPNLARAAQLASAASGRSILLEVAGPFHTDAVAPAAEPLRAALEAVEIRSPRVPVVSNVTARPYRAPGEIRRLLVAQMTARVEWRRSVEWLWGEGVRTFADMGPGSVVGGLAAKIRRGLEVAAHA